jgi:hypothetical protein
MATSDRRTPARDMPTFSIRLEPDLRRRLEEAAFKAERSLGREISIRLWQSLETPTSALTMDQPTAGKDPAIHDGEPVTAAQRELIRRFAVLPFEQQMALLVLLRGFPPTR